jgi:hypothetical protein
MRIIEQFVQAIGDIMLRRKAGKYKEARGRFQNLLQLFLRQSPLYWADSRGQCIKLIHKPRLSAQ